jgi:chromosome partitioning protein
MAITIAVANQKGGVGKTTTAVNIAGALARSGAPTLLIDLDPQGNATTSLGLNKQALDVTVYEVLIGSVSPHGAVQPTGRAQYSVIPATQNLAGAEIELVQLDRREWRLAESLAEVGDFDYILIDCPPSLGLLTLNALCAADYVLIPLQCEYLALEGLAQLKGTVDRVRQHLNHRLAMIGVVTTMYDGRTNLAQQVLEEVRRYFPNHIFERSVPRSIRVGEAPSYGKLLIEYDPQSRASAAYTALAQEIITRTRLARTVARTWQAA